MKKKKLKIVCFCAKCFSWTIFFFFNLKFRNILYVLAHVGVNTSVVFCNPGGLESRKTFFLVLLELIPFLDSDPEKLSLKVENYYKKKTFWDHFSGIIWFSRGNFIGMKQAICSKCCFQTFEPSKCVKKINFCSARRVLREAFTLLLTQKLANEENDMCLCAKPCKKPLLSFLSSRSPPSYLTFYYFSPNLLAKHSFATRLVGSDDFQ